MNRGRQLRDFVIQIAGRLRLFVLRFYWFLFRPQTYGVKVVIEQDSRILLVRHTYRPNVWKFPGGGIHKKETPIQAARRETREELNLDLHSIQTHGSFVSTLEYKRDNITVCSGQVTGSIDTASLEIAEAQWFTKNSTPEFGPVARKVYKIYEQR